MLQTLQLTNIRSYKSGLFEFAPGVNIIVGANASGKTNLLEAVHLMARGHAFKSGDDQMIAYGSEWGRIEARVDDQTRVVKLKPKSKIFVIDDLEKKRLSAEKQLPTVLFEPSHLLILGGEPERRRSYIDELLSQTEFGYEPILRDYRRALAQRNKLLKYESLQPDQLFVWDVRLSDLAGKLLEYRLRYVDLLNAQISQNYQAVSGNKEALEIRYESKLDRRHYANDMLQNLKKTLQLDLARGYTGIGPHRDDLAVILKKNDARESASRGETRSIVLALKLTELAIITERQARKPLLLLDDVFSELDGKRRRTLAQTLKEYQTFITTTDADVVIEHFSKSCNIIPL